MNINADFTKRVAVHSTDMEWVESPMAGVTRRSLDRIGEEVARATTIVRYEAGSKFSPHVHTGGEEFLVLEGVFQDEHGDFPVGSYVRNPPESSHTPGSDVGCIIFVKLWQFDLADRTEVKIKPNTIEPIANITQQNIKSIPLYSDKSEEVSIQEWKANTNVNISASNGIEVLVLHGSFEESNESFKQYSWLRLPVGSTLKAKAGRNGTKVWIKAHHLNRVKSETKRINSLNSD